MRAIAETQEQERQRIARDLHDGLGTQFNAIRMYVGLLSEPQDSTDDSISVEHTQGMIDKAVADLRLITWNLLPITFAKYGLIIQLYELKAILNKTNSIKIHISINNEGMRFNQEFEINLYRILQEMINNTLKYAKAGNIYISFESGVNDLKIYFKDDGMGFEKQSMAKGFGIQNIETRVQFYDGRMELKSAPLEGTSYAINFDKKQIEAHHVRK